MLQSFTSRRYTAPNQSQMWLQQREKKWCKEGFPPPTLPLQAWLNRDNNRSLAVQKIVEVKKRSCVFPESKSFQCVSEQGSESDRKAAPQSATVSMDPDYRCSFLRSGLQSSDKQDNLSFFSPPLSQRRSDELQ